MCPALADQLVQSRDADTGSQAPVRAAALPESAANAQPETRGHRGLRSVTIFLRRLTTTRSSYYDPLFGRPDLIEDDYYRLRHQNRG